MNGRVRETRTGLVHRMRFDDVIERLSLPKLVGPKPESISVVTRIERREEERAERARKKVARASWAIRLGERIKKRRLFHGLTRKELSQRAGYKTEAYLYEIETGERLPSDKVLRRICAAMGEPFEDNES